jgi:hypothetical protein
MWLLFQLMDVLGLIHTLLFISCQIRLGGLSYMPSKIGTGLVHLEWYRRCQWFHKCVSFEQDLHQNWAVLWKGMVPISGRIHQGYQYINIDIVIVVCAPCAECQNFSLLYTL